MKFLVTGGSGFIGSRLCQVLINAGHGVTILTRNKENTAALFHGQITLIDSLEDIKSNFDVIINLAGESLSDGYWTTRKKQAFYDSRLNTTQEIINYLRKTPAKPSLLLSGSAIGFYGHSATEVFTEDSMPSVKDLPHDLCHKWEETAYLAKRNAKY